MRMISAMIATSLAISFGTVALVAGLAGASPTSGSGGITWIAAPNGQSPSISTNPAYSQSCNEATYQGQSNTWTTELCLEATASSLFVSGQNVSGPTFTGHIEVLGPTIDTNTPSGASWGMNAYTSYEALPPGTYCAILWKYDTSTGNYANVNSVCNTWG